MKKLLFLVFVVFVGLGGYAQDQKIYDLDRELVLKYNALSSAIHSFSFEIEQMINDKDAITVGIGIPCYGSLIGQYGIEVTPNNVWQADLSTLHFRAAYRHYTGRSRLPRGFYIEPYLKYQEVYGDAVVNLNDKGTRIPTLFKTNFNTVNAGFQMGVQCLVAKTIAVDFYFFGLEAGLMNGNMIAIPRNFGYYNNMRSKIDHWISNAPSYIRDKLVVTDNFNGYYHYANVRADNVPYPWFRGGISIGLAF